MIKKIIYNKYVNFCLRNLSYIFRSILPEKFKIPVSGTFRLKISKDNAIKINTNPTSYISKQLFWNGSDNYEFTLLFKKIIKTSSSFIDIGANFGYYSLLAAKLNKEIKVHCFEPSPGPLQYLNENVKLNSLENKISIYNLALSDQKGKLDFHVVENKKFSNFLNLSGEHNTGSKKLKNSTQIVVESVTLDSLFLSKNIKFVDLIKIDVEGAEHLVIQGAKSIIQECKPIIICEILKQENATYIQSELKQMGFEAYIFSIGKLVKVDHIRVDELNKNDYFFIHSEKNKSKLEFAM